MIGFIAAIFFVILGAIAGYLVGYNENKKREQS
jgi:ABC-type dipeptide/oligopeptide/nickel transport system permease subunit